MESTLCGTTITGKYLEKLLKTKISRPVSDEFVLKAVNGRVIGDGNGYTSVVLQVRLTWVKKGEMQDEKPMVANPQIMRLKQLRANFARSSTWA